MPRRECPILRTRPERAGRATPPRSSHSYYTGRPPEVSRKPSRRAAHSCGYSPTTRWPAAGTTRSGARRRRAYSIPSSSGMSRSRAPQRTSAGQRTRSRYRRGSSCPERARRALDVLVLRLGLEEAGDDLRRERARVLGAPVAEDAGAQVRAAGDDVARPGDQAAGPKLADQVEPDAGAARQRDDAGRRDQRQRDDRLRPLGGEVQRRRRRPSSSRRRPPAAAPRARPRRRRGPPRSPRLSTAGSGAVPPWPGRSGTSTRCRSASSGASAVKLYAAPPRPWTRTSGAPSPPTQ